MDSRDTQKMIKLAREGKDIAKIWDEDFPQYDYWDIYNIVYDAGEKSSLGMRKMITHRFNKLSSQITPEQQEILDEVDDLVWRIYDRYRESQKKLQKIRQAIEE